MLERLCWRSRSGACHRLRQAPQPHDANGHPTLHPADQCLLQKVRNHAAAVALDTLYYNFARPHRSLNDPYPRTPAMAAGMADHIWTCEEIAGLLD